MANMKSLDNCVVISTMKLCSLLG